MSKSTRREKLGEKPSKEESSNKATFQSRKTIADYIKENMSAKNRKSYYQRLIAITQHKENYETFIEFIRNKWTSILDQCNANVTCERISGIYLYYKENSVFLIEGSEDVIGNFMIELCKIEKTLFEELKILTFVNNIGNTYFQNFFWLTYEPPSSTAQLKDDAENAYENAQHDILTKLERLFCALGTEYRRKTILLNSESVLSSNYVKIVPTINVIQFLLKAKHLYNLSEYAECFQKLPPTVDYDCVVWPIPFDHTPLDVFKTGKYDVNLTFKGTA